MVCWHQGANPLYPLPPTPKEKKKKERNGVLAGPRGYNRIGGWREGVRGSEEESPGVSPPNTVGVRTVCGIPRHALK